MNVEFKNTPAMETAIQKRIHDITWSHKLDNYKAADIVFAIFNMGREGFKLEDITVEAVIESINKMAN